VFSALEVCYENALYKFTFDIWHTHTVSFCLNAIHICPELTKGITPKYC